MPSAPIIVVVLMLCGNSLADLTDLNLGLKGLDSTFFPGVSSDVQVHGGFADEHAQTASTILAEVKNLLSSSGASTVVTVSGSAHHTHSPFLTTSMSCRLAIRWGPHSPNWTRCSSR